MISKDDMGEIGVVIRKIEHLDTDLRGYGSPTPLWYGVIGSHMHGYASESSDIDVIGVHIAPEWRYSSLEQPTPHIVVNKNGKNVVDGFEHIELQSMELREFASQLCAFDVHAYQLLYGSIAIDRYEREWFERLAKQTVVSHFPGVLSEKMMSMTHSNVEDISDDPMAAKFYLRCFALGYMSREIDREQQINPGVVAAARRSGRYEGDLVSRLLNYRRMSGDKPVSPGLHEESIDLLRSIVYGKREIDVNENARRMMMVDLQNMIETTRERFESENNRYF